MDQKKSVFDRDPIGYYEVNPNQDYPFPSYIEKKTNSGIRKDILRKIFYGKGAGRAKNIASRAAVIGSVGAGTGLGAYHLLNKTGFIKDNSLKSKLIAGGSGALIGGLGGAYLGNRYDRKVAEYADEPEEFLKRDAKLKRLNEAYKHLGSKINAYT